MRIPALLLVLLLAAGSPDELDERFAALDAAPPGRWHAELEALVLLGEPAARRALSSFPEAGHPERISRARLLAEIAAPETIPEVVGLLTDSDPEVRSILVRLLGELALGASHAELRTAALVERARSDRDRVVRAAAIESLARGGLPGAVDALDELLTGARRAESAAAALALGRLPAGRRRLVTRVRDTFAEPPGDRLDTQVLAALLASYGRALAELPRGGEEAGDRVPLVHGVTHPSEDVRSAAHSALDDVLVRLTDFGEFERADRLLSALAKEGLEPHRMLYRRILIELSQTGDADHAVSLAQLLARAAALAPVQEAPLWRYYALHLTGAALFARGDLEPAYEHFGRATLVVRTLLAERPDRRGTRERPSAAGGTEMVGTALLLAVDELWQAACLLGAGRGTGNLAVLQHARNAHETLMQAQVLRYSSGSPADPSNLDVILQHDLGPSRLVLLNRRLPRWNDERALNLLMDLGQALATVAPWEMPGFVPVSAPDRRLTDPLFDPARFAFLVQIREAQYAYLLRERNDRQVEAARLQNLARPDNRILDLMLREIRYRKQEEIERRRQLQKDPRSLDPSGLLELYHHLATYTKPSDLGRSLGENLRTEGRTGEARALGERMLADLRAGLPGGNDVWVGWTSARVELMIGSTYMDEGRPAEAETVCLAAVRRLEALENTIDSQGGVDSQLQTVRDQRANALLSLAVNANVRMGDQQRALDYFERAYELDQRDFMQVLLACYRARSGNDDEARAVLRTVRPAPALYYNLACTYAMLGDADEAIDLLQRDFLENHPSAGSLERQKTWAREDPDLEALRGDSRFQRLVAPRR